MRAKIWWFADLLGEGGLFSSCSLAKIYSPDHGSTEMHISGLGRNRPKFNYLIFDSPQIYFKSEIGDRNIMSDMSRFEGHCIGLDTPEPNN